MNSESPWSTKRRRMSIIDLTSPVLEDAIHLSDQMLTDAPSMSDELNGEPVFSIHRPAPISHPLKIAANKRIEPLGIPGDSYALGTFDLSRDAAKRLADGRTQLPMDGLLYADEMMHEFLHDPSEGTSMRGINTNSVVGDGQYGVVYGVNDYSGLVVKIEPLVLVDEQPGTLPVHVGDVEDPFDSEYHRISELQGIERSQYDLALGKFHREVATHLYVSHMAHRAGLGDRITPRLRGAWFAVTRADSLTKLRRYEPYDDEEIVNGALIFTAYMLMDRFSKDLKGYFDSITPHGTTPHIIELQLHIMPQIARILEFMRMINIVHHDAHIKNWGVTDRTSNKGVPLICIIDWGRAAVYDRGGDILKMYSHPLGHWPETLEDGEIRPPVSYYFNGKQDSYIMLRELIEIDARAYPFFSRTIATELLQMEAPDVKERTISRLLPPMGLYVPIRRLPGKPPEEVIIPEDSRFLGDLMPPHLLN